MTRIKRRNSFSIEDKILHAPDKREEPVIASYISIYKIK